MKTFLTVKELTVENGGYLTSKTSGKPVGNADFNAAQKSAEFVVTLANAAKDKDFKGKSADSLSDLKALVVKQLSGTEATVFVKGPKALKRPTTDALKNEALAFLKHDADKNNAEKVNEFLQQFKVINEFEDFGLFFDAEISKLNKVYTMKEIIAAVESVIEILD